MAGSASPPLMSLMPVVPAASAASATRERVVSMVTVRPAADSSRITGSTRRSSSAAATRLAPGRVDSPPTSMMSAPERASARPCWMALAAARWVPGGHRGEPGGQGGGDARNRAAARDRLVARDRVDELPDLPR
jgi:hypothetical protein